MDKNLNLRIRCIPLNLRSWNRVRTCVCVFVGRFSPRLGSYSSEERVCRQTRSIRTGSSRCGPALVQMTGWRTGTATEMVTALITCCNWNVYWLGFENITLDAPGSTTFSLAHIHYISDYSLLTLSILISEFLVSSPLFIAYRSSVHLSSPFFTRFHRSHSSCFWRYLDFCVQWRFWQYLIAISSFRFGHLLSRRSCRRFCDFKHSKSSWDWLSVRRKHPPHFW